MQLCLPTPLVILLDLSIDMFICQADKWMFTMILLTQGDPVPLQNALYSEFNTWEGSDKILLACGIVDYSKKD